MVFYRKRSVQRGMRDRGERQGERERKREREKDSERGQQPRHQCTRVRVCVLC